MRHELSDADLDFRHAFESAALTPDAFDHRAHVRLAYVYLAENDDHTATTLMRLALHGFLDAHAIGRAKYHETLTRAWILAVRHFMSRGDARSADAFIDANPELLDPKILLTHYSAEVLFSPAARASFVEPDRGAIPRY